MNGTKWADHIITEVSEINGVITHVKIAEDGNFRTPTVDKVHINYVLLILDTGRSIVTVHKDKFGHYRKGANVEKITINGKDHIRSKHNQNLLDNLDSLPRF